MAGIEPVITMHTSAIHCIALFLIGCTGCGVESPFKKQQQLYLQVIQRIQKGEIKTEGEKKIKIPEGSTRLAHSAQLPLDLRTASVDGEVYVLRPSADQLIVVFKTWRGKGFNMEGYLYAAKPLNSIEVTKDYYARPVVILGPIELVLEKQLTSNWYHVSHKLD